ncbi:MAG: LysR family transcriptional regulator [Sandaracinaceae bacterium]|nr:LysR family transcriptional regulator [Sandaracinaceae bacterium]
MPSLESLRCFLAAARLLNFRAASRSVSLTPTAFSQRIRQLEEQLGAPLFLRTTRSVRLSREGQALIPVAERCIAAAEDCARVVKGDASSAPIEFTIGTRHELGLSWLLPAYDSISKAFPYLALQLHFGSGPDLMFRVASLQADCAVTSARNSDARLDAIPIHREDYVFVGAPKLLTKTPCASVKDLARHVLLDTDSNLSLFRYLQDVLDVPEGVRFARTVRLGTIEAIRRRALLGAGVAVLPVYLVAGDLKAKKLQRLLPRVTPLHDYFRLVFRRDSPRREVFEALAKQLSTLPLR